MRALITGIGGFVGGHLAARLRQEGFRVWGIDRLLVSADITDRAVTVELGDFCDPAFTSRVVHEARPTHVFHLAWEFDPNRPGSGDAADRNVLGVTTLLESIRGSADHARVMIASSSAVYGAAEQLPAENDAPPKPATTNRITCGTLDPELTDIEVTPNVMTPQRTSRGMNDHRPIDEDAPLNPTNAYGISKVAVETVAASFRATHGMDIVVTRTFNLLGPGMPSRLFAGSLAAQIVAAERGGSPVIKVGRLDSSRDYIDVRDAARAYLALASGPTQQPRIFNVCAGVARSCRELADEMMALASVPVTLDYDASRMQTGDLDYQQGSAERLRRATGWMRTIAFSTSVRDTLDHARKRAG